VLESLVLPEGVILVRSTSELTIATLPPGLLAAHHLSSGAWGVIRVLQGHVVFVTEDDGAHRTITAGETQVVEPEVRHHIEPSDDAAIVIDFYR
jgi:tellurite methyltransferase